VWQHTVQQQQQQQQVQQHWECGLDHLLCSSQMSVQDPALPPGLFTPPVFMDQSNMQRQGGRAEAAICNGGGSQCEEALMAAASQQALMGSSSDHPTPHTQQCHGHSNSTSRTPEHSLLCSVLPLSIVFEERSGSGPPSMFSAACSADTPDLPGPDELDQQLCVYPRVIVRDLGVLAFLAAWAHGEKPFENNTASPMTVGALLDVVNNKSVGGL